MDNKSKSFIRTDGDKWGIAGTIPIVNGNIPVISAIGTSRDGKSTSLNLYANWLINKYSSTQKTTFNMLSKQGNGNCSPVSNLGKNIEPFSPFVAMQTDDVVTNGIDYYQVSDKCMLIDCQGMQLKDARHDHYLMLVTYLISNIIILTVRERLDLQVLNNCLAVFSFLNEIPSEFKRKDKPTLLIRIKDFQNNKQLNLDPNYLKKLVDKWLEKSNDQYDQIKEAFRNTFNIDVVATKYPTMDEHDEVNIHDPDFLSQNKSFQDYCVKLDELSKGQVAPQLLKSDGKLHQLITCLQENKAIDWKKLDLYHQITENELRKYLQENLTNDPILTKKLVDQMNGSKESSFVYLERRRHIDKIKQKLYYEKFKDITSSIKDEVFKTSFDKFNDIFRDARNKNKELAENIIAPHYRNFNGIYTDINFKNYFIDKIINYFTDKKKIFEQELNKIDYLVSEKYMLIINEEEHEINNKQRDINTQNIAHCKKIKLLIKNYDINIKTNEFCLEYLNCAIQAGNYNESYDYAFSNIKNKIITDLSKIYNDNDITWYMETDKNIASSGGKKIWTPIVDFDNMVDKSTFENEFWKMKETIFSKMCFIKNCTNGLNTKINSGINFDYVICGKFKFIMTRTFAVNNKVNIDICKYINTDLNKKMYVVSSTISNNLNTEIFTIETCFVEDETVPIFAHLLELAIGKYIAQNWSHVKYSNCKVV